MEDADSKAPAALTIRSDSSVCSTSTSNHVESFLKNDSGETCIICTEPNRDSAHVLPCGHRLGCWSCIMTGLHTLAACWLCRQPVTCLVRERSGHMLTIPALAQTTGHSQRRSRRQWRSDREGPRPVTNVERQVLRRLYVYQHRLFSKHIGSSRRSGHREVTPHVFRNDPALQSRAKAFLRRELRVFSYMSTNSLPQSRDTPARVPTDDPEIVRQVETNVDWLIRVLKIVDLKDSSGAMVHHVESLLDDLNFGDQELLASLFIHELRAFLMSPYTRLGEWDASVQYDRPMQGRARVPRLPGEDRRRESPFEAAPHDTMPRDLGGMTERLTQYLSQQAEGR